jgi:endoplasmic reticulum junction formation protein lunapark
MGSIYLIRTAITTYYVYRIDTVTSRLEEQQSERAKTIEKLKAATKYDSTQQLLEKYGGAAPQSSPKPKSQQNPAKGQRKTQKQPQRTGIGPPATANIPRNQLVGSPPATPQSIPQNAQLNRFPPANLSPPTLIEQPGPPEFAPNAFGTAPQYDRSSEPNGEGNWYDRILDLLLGEDETSPKNRIVLICHHCRIVNGQAPPGVKRLEDLGRWKCFGCGGWNGEVDEGTKIVEKIKERAEAENQDQQEKAALKHGVGDLSEGSVEDADEKFSEEESFEEIEAGHEVEAKSDEKAKVRRRKGLRLE